MSLGDPNSPYIDAINNFLTVNPNSTGADIVDGIATTGSGFRDHKVKHWIGELARRGTLTSVTPDSTIWYQRIWNTGAGGGGTPTDFQVRVAGVPTNFEVRVATVSTQFEVRV